MQNIYVNNKHVVQSHIPSSEQEEILYDRQESAFLFMSRHEWEISFGVAIFLSIILFPWYNEISLWIGMGLILTTLTLINIIFAARYMLPYPQLAVLIACIQLILAAWGNYYYPHPIPVYNIYTHLPEYLFYVSPACILFAFGLFAPFISTYPQVTALNYIDKNQIDNKYLTNELNYIFTIGISASLLKGFIPISLQFVAELLGNLSYIGLFGYLLFDIPGWKSRAFIFVGLILFKSLQAGIFHNFILWGASFTFGIIYCYKWSVKRISAILIAGVMGVIMLNSVKIDYREQFWYGKKFYGESRFSVFFNVITDNLFNYDRLFSHNKLSDLFVRLNQGWIVNRSMLWTPRMEPYANGKTIADSIVGSLVPRFLNPEKEAGGYKDDYQKYTGLELMGTSMSLGYAGEMYVNFGPVWGVLGVGVYGLLLGLGFRWLYKRALTHPLWWGWAAYFATPAIKAEDSIGFIINWLIKAVVIMFAVLWLCPALRAALGMNKTTSNWN